jgi:quercetin dioxygenase-like cupin family protein
VNRSGGSRRRKGSHEQTGGDRAAAPAGGGPDGLDDTRVDVRSIAPGQATGVHSHPCHVIGHIAEGTAILEVEGQPPQRY